MQGLLEQAYEQIEEDYITNVNTHMRNYQRWFVGRLSTYLCVICSNSFAKAIGFLGQEVSASVGAGSSDKVISCACESVYYFFAVVLHLKMSKAAKQLLKDKFKVKCVIHEDTCISSPPSPFFLTPPLPHRGSIQR